MTKDLSNIKENPSLSEGLKKGFSASTDQILVFVKATLTAKTFLMMLADYDSVHNTYKDRYSDDSIFTCSFSDRGLNHLMTHRSKELNGLIASIMVYCGRSSIDIVWLYSKFKDLDGFYHELCYPTVSRSIGYILSEEEGFYAKEIIALAKEVKSSLDLTTNNE
jgi:hypothetical protein